MTTELDELRSARPQVAPPSDHARTRAYQRLSAAIEDEPAGLYERRAHRAGRRPRWNLGTFAAAFGVLVTVAILVGGIALLGHRAPRHRVGAAAHPGRILAADGSPLKAEGPLASVLGPAGLRTQYRSALDQGEDLRTTLDASLQRVADHALRQTLVLSPGAVQASLVAMDPNTGAIEAIGSTGAGSARVDAAVQTASAPAGTFDPITAFAALAGHRWTPSRRFNPTGSFCVGAGADRQCRHNADGGAFLPIRISSALAFQPDTYMYKLGAVMNVPAVGHPRGGDLQSWASTLGLGRRPQVDLPGAAAGLLPTPRWRDRLRSEGRADRPWSEGDELSLAVGQGDVAVTPLQLAVAYAGLQTGVIPLRPHLGESLVGHGGTRSTGGSPILARLPVAASTFAPIRAGMRRETSPPGGPSYDVFGEMRPPVEGQLGTTLVTNHNDDGWFAGWVDATASHGPLVVVVRVIGGGFGDASAAPVARQLFSQWTTGRPGPWLSGSSTAGS